jgi:hypothetical protein
LISTKLCDVVLIYAGDGTKRRLSWGSTAGVGVEGHEEEEEEERRGGLLHLAAASRRQREAVSSSDGEDDDRDSDDEDGEWSGRKVKYDNFISMSHMLC